VISTTPRIKMESCIWKRGGEKSVRADVRNDTKHLEIQIMNNKLRDAQLKKDWV